MQRAQTGSWHAPPQHCRSVYTVIIEHSLPHGAFVIIVLTFMPAGTEKQKMTQDEFTRITFGKL